MPKTSSGRIKLYFKSGQFKAEPERFQEELLAAFQGAIEEGTENFLAAYLGKVARKTGALRRWFKRMINMQGDIVGDIYRVILKFKSPPTTPDYFIYHIPGLASKTRFRVGVPYKYPTTKHTEPISIKRVLTLWSSKIEAMMNKKFQELGVSVSSAVSTKWYKHG